MALITGNTFKVKDQLKALGGKWNPGLKGWIIPDSAAEKAREIVGESGPAPRRRGPRVCGGCGCRINYGAYCGKCEFGR